MQLDVLKDDAPTEVGSYFVSNYPPYSTWRPDATPEVLAALQTPAADAAPLGLYLHIPFCRKRCRFCYFRVYTDKNSSDVETYCDALAREVALYASCPGLAGRDFEFVYFGGGTPSFLSDAQLDRLIQRISEHWTWSKAREVTFECEPGTLKHHKLKTIKGIGVTRLSLGVEHFDDDVLEMNGRAHKSPEIFKAYEWIRDVGFDQVNVDLIAGMIGDTEAKWRDTVAKALAMEPDSLTVYQMELPHNTVIARESSDSGSAPAVADWTTKRAWVDYAFKVFEEAGYVVSSAYTMLKPGPHSQFVYRDSVWHGADMVGTGVASFSHFRGVHYQNIDRWEDYIAAIDDGRLPVSRALPIEPIEQLTRELVLQMKTGRLDAAYFRGKYGVEILSTFSEAFANLQKKGHVHVNGDQITLTRAALLRADALLPMFFDPRYRDIRYT
jgi:oxygen-independent coproporphyrinogen-3 oxidase